MFASKFSAILRSLVILATATHLSGEVLRFHKYREPVATRKPEIGLNDCFEPSLNFTCYQSFEKADYYITTKGLGTGLGKSDLNELKSALTDFCVKEYVLPLATYFECVGDSTMRDDVTDRCIKNDAGMFCQVSYMNASIYKSYKKLDTDQTCTLESDDCGDCSDSLHAVLNSGGCCAVMRLDKDKKFSKLNPPPLFLACGAFYPGPCPSVAAAEAVL